MPPVEARLRIVQEAVEMLWASRSDGRWSALERALVDVLTPKKKTPTRPGRWDCDAGGHWIEVGTTCAVCAIPTEVLLQAARSQAHPTPAGDNVIVLTRALVTRMRRKA